MKNITVFILVIFTCLAQPACSTHTPNNIDYQWIDESKKLKSDLSPLGYWEINLKYPILNGNKDTVKGINERIMTLISEFQCASGGDFTFNSSLEYADANFMSLKFERMWMCSTMPGPDSDQGVLNINISTGTDIKLASELKSQEALSSLQDLTNNKKSDCDIGMLNLFSFDSSGLTFYQTSLTHDEAGCTVGITHRELQPLLKNNSPLKAIYLPNDK